MSRIKKRDSLRRMDIVTLFPAMFEGPMTQSLLGRARDRGLINVQIHDLRRYSAGDRHRTVDDRPYGGGPGMVLQAEPIYKALKAIKAAGTRDFGGKQKFYVIYMSPQGRVLTQKQALDIAARPWVIVLCGHYEGVDERIMDFVDEEVSIGDYVLTGGELPAMVLAETVLRLIPGVVKEPGSLLEESFQERRLDFPHYTRPSVWRQRRVPAVLLSGNHQAIKAWRSKRAQSATLKKRPDLLSR